MNLIFLLAYIAWGLSEVLLNRFMRSKTTDQQDADKNSLSLIWITISISITLAILIAMNYYAPISTNLIIPYLGLAMILIGVVLRLVIIRSLGQFFTVDVTIREDHRLKKDGFYKYLRHPSYFASLLSFVGFGLSLNNWISLILVSAAIIVAFINRIKVEEKVLVEHFGEEYIAYQKTTKRLIPFIY